MPEHNRAFGNGCVYEHLVVAEQEILHRSLNGDECVHHINHNRSDNQPENLMVFATNNDHAAFHQGCHAELTGDGTYICQDKYNNRICPLCGGIKAASSNKCMKCKNK